MKTKYLLHMLLLGRSRGAAAHAIRLSQEHSGNRNSEETWSSPRADPTTAAASCRVPSPALCATLFSLEEDFTLHSSFDRLFQGMKKRHFSCEKRPSWKREVALSIMLCLKEKAVAFPCPVSILPHQAAAQYFQTPDLPWADRNVHR